MPYDAFVSPCAAEFLWHGDLQALYRCTDWMLILFSLNLEINNFKFDTMIGRWSRRMYSK